MKVGLTFFPTRPEYLIPTAKRADEIGYDSIWVPEHMVFPTHVTSQYPYAQRGAPLPDTPLHDPLIALACVAAVTTKVKLGTGIYILPLRHPIAIARQVTSLDTFSNGRFLFGIGVGWLKEETEAAGSVFEERGPRSDEIIQALHTLWKDDRPSFQGKYYQFPEVGFQPKPVNKAVPILVGGESKPALRRAARLGDGWFGMGHTPESVKQRVQELKKFRGEYGRANVPFDITVQIEGEPTVDNLKRYEEAGAHRVTLAARTLAKGKDVASAVAGVEEFANRVLSKL